MPAKHTTWLYSICTIGILCIASLVSAQTLPGEDNLDGSDPAGATDNTQLIQVFPKLLDSYCESGQTIGKVTITESPALGLQYEIEGEGKVLTLTSGGTVQLPVGSYYWRVLSSATVGVEPREGSIRVDEVCVDGGTQNDAAGNTAESNEPTATTNTANSSEPIDSTISTSNLLPPASFDVLRDNRVTFVLIDGGSNVTSDLYAYRIYRRCEDNTWWSIAKVLIQDCGGYACSHQVTDKYSVDTCEYSVSSMNSAGVESARTSAKRPDTTNDSSGSDTIEPTDYTQTGGGGAVSDAQKDTVDVQIETSSDEPITTEDVTRHVATGKYIIMLDTDDASHVEWVMYPDGSNTSTYLGKATYNAKTGFWEYVWDTTQVPNGDYVLVPKISSLSGRSYKDAPTHVRVKNEQTTTYTEEEKKLVDIVKEAAGEVEKVVSESDQSEESMAKEEVIRVLDPYAKELQEYVEKNGEEAVRQEIIDEQERIKKELTTLLNIESSKLLRALDGDEEEFKRFENKILIAAQESSESIRKIAEEFGFELSERELVQLENEVEERLEGLKEVIQKRRAVLKDRVGEKVFEDTDKDGISNYDEVNIYGTDPLKADTDNDGFFDGAEILGGFNPLNPASEAVVEYENPRTSGFVEEDDFTVEDVKATEVVKDETGNERAEKIRLSGKAPANSFVTLYIYSDPIIVTVKTDSEGNWVYELDKELEDGSHEAYVAITDNAGRIYAKSRPLPFVKEAAAVTIDEAALFNPDAGEAPSIFGSAYIYLVVLLIVAVIGWALVFTGSRQSRFDEEVV